MVCVCVCHTNFVRNTHPQFLTYHFTIWHTESSFLNLKRCRISDSNCTPELIKIIKLKFEATTYCQMCYLKH